MSEKQKSFIKTGEEIFDFIDDCFNRHCRTLYNMHEDEIPEYEKELALLNNQKWVNVDSLVAKLRAQLKANKKLQKEVPTSVRVKYAIIFIEEFLGLLDVKEKKQVE